MRTPQTVRQIKEEGPPTGSLSATGLLALVQQLIKQAAPSDVEFARSGIDEKEQAVLLDVEVDGVRCVLIRAQPHTQRAYTLLSPREHEIVRMVAEGYPNKTIAAVLEISAWTVNTHLRRIFAKLGVGSRAAMVARLLDEGAMSDQRKPTAPPFPLRRR
ncbi:MAG: response regulator transcription factor [Pyrinomonadaceae bacterium]